MTFTRGASDPDSYSDSASSYTSPEEVERNEKKVNRSLPSPNKIPVVSSAPKHPPPPPVSSKDNEIEVEEDSEDDGFSDEEFDEGDTAELEMKRQPHNLSDHDSSDETPPSAPNPLPPVPSKDDRDKDDNENVDSKEDESSGESDDGETTGMLPSSDSSLLDPSSLYPNLQSHNASDLKSTSSMREDASPETIMDNSPSPLPARGSRKRKHGADSSENNQNRKHTSSRILWSLDDEIALLKGLVEYHSENDTVPSSTVDIDGVRHLIKSSIRLEVSDKQFADKVKRLKQNFLTSYACSKNKVSLKYSDLHEQDLYELSKKLWGVKTITTTEEVVSSDSDDAKESEQKSNEEVLDSRSTHSEMSLRNRNGNLSYPLLWETVNKLADGYSCGVAIRKAFEMVDDAKANVLENNLKKLRENEIKHHLSGVNLNNEMVKLILDCTARTK